MGVESMSVDGSVDTTSRTAQCYMSAQKCGVDRATRDTWRFLFESAWAALGLDSPAVVKCPSVYI